MIGDPLSLDSQTSPAGAVALIDRADEHHQAKLAQYVNLLLRWNRVYNLTSVRDSAGVWARHVDDCLTCITPLLRERKNAHPRLLDVGSGAGLPGIVIAIMLPEFQVTCVDAVAKKTAFLSQVVAELGLNNVSVHHARVETLGEDRFDFITSRAFSSLPQFVQCTERLLAPTGQWMAMKGEPPIDEIATLSLRGDLMFHVEPLEARTSQEHRCLIWGQKAKQ